jgi:hypothetical protein
MRWSGVVSAVLLGMLVPANALAGPTWLAPVTLSQTGEENAPADVGVGPDGTVIAVWQRAMCTTPDEAQVCENGRVQYSVRPPGGSFSPAADMPGDPFASNQADPRLAFDGAGNAIAVWKSGSGETARIRYSLRPAGGDFGGSKAISDMTGGFHAFPDLAMAPDGRAVVTFGRFVGGVDRAAYAVRAPGGDFGPAQTMVGDPGTTLNQTPAVRMDASGAAVAVWTSSSPAASIRYAELPAGSTEFGPTETIEKGGNGRVALAPSGAAVILWSVSGSAADLEYAFRPPGGEFGLPRTLPEPDGPLVTRVAIAPDGSAVASWRATNMSVRWAAAPPGGPFGPPNPMPPGGQGAPGDLQISDQGTALALWVDQEGPVWQLRASLRPPGGVFGDPSPLAGPPQGVNNFGVSAAFDPQGNAVALWSGRDPISKEPHDVPLLAAGLDAAGPRLEALEIPARGRDDRAVAMSMTPFDVWSPVASTIFRFGDRRSAPGPSARHRYRAGRYTVEAIAMDAVGNSTVATRPLKVADVTRPRIRRLRVRPKRFILGEGGTARTSRRAPSTIRFRLSERARVRFVVQRPRRSGPRRATSRAGFASVGSFVRRNLKRGANRIGFSGRVKSKALAPGDYRIVAVATDPAKRRSRPARASFQVLSR